MNTIYYDAVMTDDERRQKLFDGQLFDYTPRPRGAGGFDNARRRAVS